jgi:hypothetical protein
VAIKIVCLCAIRNKRPHHWNHRYQTPWHTRRLCTVKKKFTIVPIFWLSTITGGGKRRKQQHEYFGMKRSGTNGVLIAMETRHNILDIKKAIVDAWITHRGGRAKKVALLGLFDGAIPK